MSSCDKAALTSQEVQGRFHIIVKFIGPMCLMKQEAVIWIGQNPVKHGKVRLIAEIRMPWPPLLAGMWRGLAAIDQHPDLEDWQEAPELDPGAAAHRVDDMGWVEQGQASMSLATINPTSLPKYLDAILDMPSDIIAVTETMAAARDFSAIEKRAQAKRIPRCMGSSNAASEEGRWIGSQEWWSGAAYPGSLWWSTNSWMSTGNGASNHE